MIYVIFEPINMSVMNQTKELQTKRNNELSDWRKKEQSALELLKIVGDLRFDNGIELVLFRRDIYDSRPSEVLHDHKIARNYIDRDISIYTTLAIARKISDRKDLNPVKVDIGKMAAEVESNPDLNLEDYIDQCLNNLAGDSGKSIEARDVVLYGFGRIGRLLARRIISTTGRGDQLLLKAIVLRGKMKSVEAELEKRAALLLSDSVHGDFQGTVTVDAENSSIIVNGNHINFIFSNRPDTIDYSDYGIQNALLIDNTGVWRDKEGLSQHLRPGISNVILTAPGKDIVNIVYGANQEQSATENIVSAASCTTNAIVPIIKTVDDAFGIEKGHIETIHAYTSDQNLLDNFHKKPRRGRAAALNMVLTTTGAAKAVSRVLPHLKDVLTGNAVRVPTPNVSLAIMNFHLKGQTTLDELNHLLRNASLGGNFMEQIHYSTDTEYVSSSAVGMTTTSVVDSPSNIVSEDGKSAMVYAWYDNEFGYCCQVVRLAKHIAQVRRPRFY